MKRSIVLIASLAVSACGGGTQPAEEAPAPAAAPATAPAAKPISSGWTATTAIKTPESVYYDSTSGFIFASQIDGAPEGKDGNGGIVKIDGDGTVVKADFVTGLNAPKGLRVCNGTLWVADLGEVLAVDAATGAIKSRVAIPDSMFLNDIACDADTAYVTDMMGNKIYRVANNAASVAAEGDLEFPNGLLVDGNRLIVGGWGSQPKPDFSTDVKGRLYSYDLTTKQKTLITPKPTANIDGLESDGKGGYLVTDYLAGTLIHVSANGDARVIRTFKPGAADIAYVADRNIVLVPHMNENQVSAQDIAADLK
jgi:hypothetical protein